MSSGSFFLKGSQALQGVKEACDGVLTVYRQDVQRKAHSQGSREALVSLSTGIDFASDGSLTLECGYFFFLLCLATGGILQFSAAGPRMRFDT